MSLHEELMSFHEELMSPHEGSWGFWNPHEQFSRGILLMAFHRLLMSFEKCSWVLTNCSCARELWGIAHVESRVFHSSQRSHGHMRHTLKFNPPYRGSHDDVPRAQEKHERGMAWVRGQRRWSPFSSSFWISRSCCCTLSVCALLRLRALSSSSSHFSLSSFCWSYRRWGSRTCSCSRGSEVLVFISGRLINPVASESFVDGPLGVLLAFAGLRLAQLPQIARRGSAPKPCAPGKHFRLKWTGSFVALLCWMLVLYDVVALSGGVMAMEVNVDDSAVATMYGDHQAPMQDEALAWRRKVRWVKLYRTGSG